MVPKVRCSECAWCQFCRCWNGAVAGTRVDVFRIHLCMYFEPKDAPKKACKSEVWEVFRKWFESGEVRARFEELTDTEEAKQK